MAVQDTEIEPSVESLLKALYEDGDSSSDTSQIAEISDASPQDGQGQITFNGKSYSDEIIPERITVPTELVVDPSLNIDRIGGESQTPAPVSASPLELPVPADIIAGLQELAESASLGPNAAWVEQLVIAGFQMRS